jgi:hypothetical protein
MPIIPHSSHDSRLRNHGHTIRILNIPSGFAMPQAELYLQENRVSVHIHFQESLFPLQREFVLHTIIH